MHEILIIAEETTGTLLKRYLERSDMRVEVMLPAQYEEFPDAPFSVVIADSTVLSSDISESCESIRKRFQCRRIILLRPMEQQISNAPAAIERENAGVMHIVKPFKLSALSSLVRSAMSAGESGDGNAPTRRASSDAVVFDDDSR